MMRPKGGGGTAGPHGDTVRITGRRESQRVDSLRELFVHVPEMIPRLDDYSAMNH